MAFSAPSNNTESVKVADLNGHLLILEPIEYKTGIPTVHGDADAIEVRINDLDTGFNHDSVLFFNVALKNALKNKIGQKVLARIGQGTAKPGKSAPWILVDATGDADAVAKANAFIANGSVTANAGGATLSVAAAPANINDPAVQALLAQLGAKPVN
jgi:hypothetical protein